MIRFTDEGWDDYKSWAGDRKILQRLNRLIDEAERNPGEGVGKPERLRSDLSGCWSRRISDEHRLIYTHDEIGLIVMQARHHY